MKNGDLVYLTEEYESHYGILRKGEYECMSDTSTGEERLVFDWVAGNIFVPEELLITMEEKNRRDRNKKLTELGL